MKRVLGLVLFSLSWLLWGLVLLIPFVLEADLESLAVITTALIVTSEICFALSLFLLGKPFYIAMKMRLKSCWQRGRNEKKS